MSARLRIALRLGIGQMLGRGAVAVYTILMVRELTRAGYGDFAYAVAIAGICVALGDGGFGRLIIRDVARSKHPASLVREMLLVRAGAAMMATCLFAVAVAAGVFPFDLAFTSAIAAYLLLETLAGGYEAAAVGSERPERFVIAQALSAVALVAAASVLLHQESAAPVDAMVGLACASLVRVVVGWVLWRLADPAVRRRLQKLPWRKWLRDALPFLALTALAAVYYRINVVVLHVLHGPVETAPYAAALRVFDAAAILGGIAFAAVSPVISRAHVDEPDRLWALWKRMILRASVVAAALATSVAIFSSDIAAVLFGAEYENEAGRALAFLAPGMAFLILQNLTGSIVLMANEHRSVLLLTTINVTTAAAVAIALASSLGSDGAAIATTFAELLSFTTFALLVARRYRVQGEPPVEYPLPPA